MTKKEETKLLSGQIMMLSNLSAKVSPINSFTSHKERSKLPTIDLSADLEGRMIQIDDDRYTGAYSGHEYTAWWGTKPSALDDSDPECMLFWREWRDKLIYGGGDTPQEAFRDLIRKLSPYEYRLVNDKNPEICTLLLITLHWCLEPTTAIIYNSREYKAWIGDPVVPE